MEKKYEKGKPVTKKVKLHQHHFFTDIQTYTKEHPFVKFAIIFSLFLIYLTTTIIQFGPKQGVMVSLFTWSFFVFCTPIADAGILLDFPIRLLTGLRMMYSEIIVWSLATILNVWGILTAHVAYDKTIILTLLKHILTNPYPYWIVILISAAGTFLSIFFGDEILDILSNKKKSREHHSKHHFKYEVIILISTLIFLIVVYFFTISKLGLEISLF